MQENELLKEMLALQKELLTDIHRELREIKVRIQEMAK